MAYKILADNVTGNVTTDAIALTNSKVEISVSGTFTSVTFEDNKFDLGWAPVLNASDDTEVVLTTATHELQLISFANTGRSLRAIITGGTGVSIYVDGVA